MRKFKSAKSNEYMFIVSALQSTVNNQQSANPQHIVDFSKLLNIARDNNVSQRLYTLLREHHDMPHGFMVEIRKDYFSTAARNTLIYSAFKNVIEAFNKNGIDAIAMKGIALAELIYQDIGLRGMSDVDLLIRKEDIKRANDALEDMGYYAVDLSRFDGSDNYLTTCDYRSENPLHPSFHVHWHIVNSSIPASYLLKINMDEIWRDAVQVMIADVPALTMSPHHFLIHLSEHAMRVTHSASKLIYLVDIKALAERYKDTLDWHKVVETSKNYGLDKFVYNILSFCKMNIAFDVPEVVLNNLKPDKISFGEKMFYSITAKGNGFSGLSYLVHLAMNKSFVKKALFIFRTIFPPAWVLAKRYAYSSKDKNPALLYLYRIEEIVFHIFSLPIRHLKGSSARL